MRYIEFIEPCTVSVKDNRATKVKLTHFLILCISAVLRLNTQLNLHKEFTISEFL